MFKVIVIGLLVTFLAVFAFTTIDPKIQNSTPSITITNENYLSITVTGQVKKPGTYVLEAGATIDQLILAAGGVTENADANAYIETTELKKGVSYYIAPLYSEDDICGDTKLEKVNINYDTKEKLMSINGIGSATANAIISYRDQNGSFTYLEEIKQVSGIGNSTYEKIKNNIVLR